MGENVEKQQKQKLALLSNVNMNLVIRLLQREAEVYEAEGYGNELGMLMNPESSYHAFAPDITFLVEDLMELLEHHAGGRTKKRIYHAGKAGPLWGGLLGIVPQCGFSASASGLYAGRVITVGTLLAIYLSTSDEMLPVLISGGVPAATIAKILAAKALIAVSSGFFAEFVYVKLLKRQEEEMDIHAVCEEEHCHCEDGVFLSAVKHTLRIFLYIFLLSLILNVAIGAAGREALSGLFSGVPVVGEIIAALVGLIPVIGPGAMMSGLLVNAGVGVLVLFKQNPDKRQTAGIIAALYGLGVFWGVVIELTGITF